MTQSIRDPLADLELHRQRLEQNVEELQKTLRYWQSWEAEYEELKEDIQALPLDANPQALSGVATRFSGDLLTENEVKQLLAYDAENGMPTRSPKNLITLLIRRLEYVQRNVESIQSQISDLERKIENASFISKPEAHNEDSLPITEIYEELDDDGNVIFEASRTSHPDSAKPQILEALKAVGLSKEELSDAQGSSVPEKSLQEASQSQIATAPLTSDRAKPHASSPISERKAKKSVSFEDNKPNQSPTEREPNVIAKSQLSRSQITRESDQDTPRATLNSNDRILELDEDDKVIGIVPNTSIEESPEDAALRRQMQAYSMTEVGNIVAQMDLDEMGGSFDSVTDSDDETDEEEESHGMSMDEQVTPEYIQEMLNLERKLNGNKIQNIGPRADLLNDEVTALGPSKSIVQHEQQAQNAGAVTSKKGKSVRFADKLDIDEKPEDAMHSERESNNQPKPNPVADSIIERGPSLSNKEMEPKKLSRFKQSRKKPENSSAVDPNDTPSKQQLASKNAVHNDIVERSSKPSKAATDEFNPSLLQQQVKSEYYRQRNHMIQKQGGFKRDLIPEADEAMEEDYDSNPTSKKKVSLFKAARVQGGGAW